MSTDYLSDEPTDRRGFLATASGIAMAGGLAAGYGAAGLIAARYRFPAKRDEMAWVCLAALERMRDGERICNLEKAFNSRLGMRREHDTICERWMYEPCPEGPWQGKVAADVFDTVLEEYYEWRGWDKQSGLPTRSKLEELGMEDIAEVLAKEKVLIEDKGRRSASVSVATGVEKTAK